MTSTETITGTKCTRCYVHERSETHAPLCTICAEWPSSWDN